MGRRDEAGGGGVSHHGRARPRGARSAWASASSRSSSAPSGASDSARSRSTSRRTPRVLRQQRSVQVEVPITVPARNSPRLDPIRCRCCHSAGTLPSGAASCGQGRCGRRGSPWRRPASTRCRVSGRPNSGCHLDRDVADQPRVHPPRAPYGGRPVPAPAGFVAEARRSGRAADSRRTPRGIAAAPGGGVQGRILLVLGGEVVARRASGHGPGLPPM